MCESIMLVANVLTKERWHDCGKEAGSQGVRVIKHQPKGGGGGGSTS